MVDTNEAAPQGSLGIVLTSLDEVLFALTDTGDRSDPAGPPTVLDCGGGSGTLAVPLARRGASVTVVDSSIDALSLLERRATEAGVAGRVHAVQADLENLAEQVAPASVDLVLLHGVVTSTREGAPVIAAAADAVRPGGFLSLLVVNPAAGVLSRALNGDFDSALAELSDEGQALNFAWLTGQLESAGLTVRLTQGLAAFSATVPGSVVSAAHRAADVLAELDRVAATRSPYRDIAGQFHVIAQRR